MTPSNQREHVILRKISVCSRRNTLGSEVDLFRHAPGKLYAQRVDRSWHKRIPMYPAPLIGSSPSEAPGVRNADGLTSPIKSGDPRRLEAPGVPHAWSRKIEAMTVLGGGSVLAVCCSRDVAALIFTFGLIQPTNGGVHKHGGGIGIVVTLTFSSHCRAARLENLVVRHPVEACARPRLDNERVS